MQEKLENTPSHLTTFKGNLGKAKESLGRPVVKEGLKGLKSPTRPPSRNLEVQEIEEKEK